MLRNIFESRVGSPGKSVRKYKKKRLEEKHTKIKKDWLIKRFNTVGTEAARSIDKLDAGGNIDTIIKALEKLSPKDRNEVLSQITDSNNPILQDMIKINPKWKTWYAESLQNLNNSKDNGEPTINETNKQPKDKAEDTDEEKNSEPTADKTSENLSTEEKTPTPEKKLENNTEKTISESESSEDSSEDTIPVSEDVAEQDVPKTSSKESAPTSESVSDSEGSQTPSAEEVHTSDTDDDQEEESQTPEKQPQEESQETKNVGDQFTADLTKIYNESSEKIIRETYKTDRMSVKNAVERRANRVPPPPIYESRGQESGYYLAVKGPSETCYIVPRQNITIDSLLLGPGAFGETFDVKQAPDRGKRYSNFKITKPAQFEYNPATKIYKLIEKGELDLGKSD